MGLDLRLPLGLLFLTIGGLLLGYGCSTVHSEMYARSLGQNVNIIWGSIMLVFGLLMLLLAMRSRKYAAAGSTAAAAPEHLPGRSH